MPLSFLLLPPYAFLFSTQALELLLGMPSVLLPMLLSLPATLLPQGATGLPPSRPSNLGSPSTEALPDLTIESCTPARTTFQLPHPALFFTIALLTF